MPGTDRLLNALFWDKRVDPLEWQPEPTVFERLMAAGSTVTVVNKREFARSGLTIAAHRGASYVGADRVGERIAAVIAAAAERPSLTYVYDGDLDWTGHRYGVASSHWLQQLAMVDAEAEQLREELPPSVRMVIVADHGMVDSPVDDRIDVDEHPELRDGVVLLGGEARFRHLYCAGGAVDDVADAWRTVLGSRAERADPRGGDRAGLVRRGVVAGAASAGRRGGRLPRHVRRVLERRLRLRDVAGRAARVADPGGDEHPRAGLLTAG